MTLREKVKNLINRKSNSEGATQGYEMTSREKVKSIFNRKSNGIGAMWTGHPNDKNMQTSGISNTHMKRFIRS